MKIRTFFIFKIPKLDTKKVIRYLKKRYKKVIEEKDVITVYEKKGLIFKYLPSLNLAAISPVSQYLEVIDFLEEFSKSLNLDIYTIKRLAFNSEKLKKIRKETDITYILLNLFTEEIVIEEEELEEGSSELEKKIEKGIIEKIRTYIKVDSIKIYATIDNGGRIDLEDKNVIYLPKVLSFIKRAGNV